MSVTETSQLIQLILNSVLMVVACVVVLSGLWVRHTAVNTRLRMTSQAYFAVMAHEEAWGDRASHLKAQLQQLRHRYRLTHASVVTVHYALLLLASSTLMMALRTVAAWNGLIVGGLVLSVLGIAVLLLGLALALADVQASKQLLWQEIASILMAVGEGHWFSKPRHSKQVRSLLPVATRRLVKERQHSRADVG